MVVTLKKSKLNKLVAAITGNKIGTKKRKLKKVGLKITRTVRSSKTRSTRPMKPVGRPRYLVNIIKKRKKTAALKAVASSRFPEKINKMTAEEKKVEKVDRKVRDVKAKINRKTIPVKVEKKAITYPKVVFTKKVVTNRKPVKKPALKKTPVVSTKKTFTKIQAKAEKAKLPVKKTPITSEHNKNLALRDAPPQILRPAPSGYPHTKVGKASRMTHDKAKVPHKLTKTQALTPKPETEVLPQVEPEKKHPDYWSNCGQLFFTAGKAYGITDHLHTICVGNRSAVLDFLESGKLKEDLNNYQKSVLAGIRQSQMVINPPVKVEKKGSVKAVVRRPVRAGMKK